MLLTMMASTGEMWGQSSTTYTFNNSIPTTGWTSSGGSQTINSISWSYSSSTYIGAQATRIQIGSKNNPQTSAWTIQTPVSSFGNNKKITAVSITAYTTATTATYDISAGGSSVKSGSLTTSSSTYTANNLNITSGNIVITMTGSSTSKAMYLSDISVTYEDAGSSSDPSITASDVNITYDATEGSIAYTLNNATGNVTATLTTGDWLTLGTVTSSAVPFTCTANDGAQRTATVTLSFEGAQDKVVTVTQDAAPNNISDITTTNTAYTVIGTVVATNNKGFVIGDGTGYVYTYLGSASSQAINDKVKIAGTTGAYGHILQFTSNATITASQTSNYNGTPAITIVDGPALAAYNTDYQLSDYLQFEGTLSTTVDGNTTYYDISVGNVTARISYPTDAQTTALASLVSNNVRVKGYFAGTSTKNEVTYYTIMLESVEEVTNPTLTIDPATAQAFSYVVGNGPSDDQMFTVTGTNLVSADITVTISSDYEITDDQDYSSSVTIASDDIVSVRLKAGLAKGTHNGTLTLSSTDAEDVVVNLSGTVTGQAYTINIDNQVIGGTIEADLASAEEGTTVTLTAHPDAAYTFGSWTVYKDDMSTEVTVIEDQFTMPDCEVYVTATFNEKPTYAITCVASPNEGGEIEANPVAAYEGQIVTLSYLAETGYTFSSIVITKTSDGSATGITPAVSGNDFIFTMPSYPVTVTATFLTNTYEGTFALYSGDLIEGDYILVYDGKALKNTVSNSKFGIQSVTPSNYTISDPLRSIVWHIAPSETDGYWTIYNAIAGLYANGTQNSTNVSLGDDPTAITAIWAVSGTYDFRCKANEGQSTARYLRYHGSNQVFGNYASSNGGALTLYKYTVLTERTITFNGNGGTYNDETTYTQTVYDGIAANLTANKFSKANSEFAGWAQTADGDIIYADQAEVTINADLGLYAKWSTFYNITVDNSIEGGSVSIDGSITSAVEGTEITLSYSPTAGHAFGAWNVYKTGDPATTLTVTDNKFSMPAYDVTVSASFVEATTYSLITDASQIVSGKHYLIVGYKNTTAYAMGYDKGNNRSAVEVNINNNIILETAGVYEFVINNSDVNWIIYDKNTQNLNANNTYGFLYAAGGSGSNYLKTRATNNDNKGIWTISIADQTNVATVTALSTGRNNMRFNDGNSPLFACYASPTDQSDIYLFVKDNDNDLEFYGDVTYTETSIPAGETLTVTAGSVMTITNNSFANNDSDNLIIADGGQLVLPENATVQATVKKAVGHGAKSTGNWYTISSPVKNVDPASVTNLIQATPANYDFYYYNEPSGEWFNHKAAGHNVGTMTNGRGYLYWNADGDELAFAGELNTGSVEVAVTAGGSGDLKGINLIGNPYSHNIYKGAGTAIPNTGGALATGFYMLSNSDSWVACTDNTTAIKPAQGILVKATEVGIVTMTNTTAAGTSKAGNDNIRFTVANNQYEDVAYAMFNNEIGLNKINHRNPEVPMLYIPQDGTNYAIATMSDDVEMFTLSFKTVTTSKYTLSVKLDGRYDYLHIIDRLTGEDIDMLAEGEYSFMGAPKDLVDRFIVKLSYNATVNDVNDAFAYQSGNEIIVNGEGELQIFDLMGRKVMTQVVNGVQTVNVPAQGVYIFRLNGKVQKIVVR